jgi:hypothetical protein
MVVQPVARRYTDWAIPALLLLYKIIRSDWGNIWNVRQCSVLEVCRRCRQMSPSSASELLLCLSYSLILKKEAMCPSETSANFYQIAWHHIPEDTTPHSDRRENLNSQMLISEEHRMLLRHFLWTLSIFSTLSDWQSIVFKENTLKNIIHRCHTSMEPYNIECYFVSKVLL